MAPSISPDFAAAEAQPASISVRSLPFLRMSRRARDHFQHHIVITRRLESCSWHFRGADQEDSWNLSELSVFSQNTYRWVDCQNCWCAWFSPRTREPLISQWFLAPAINLASTRVSCEQITFLSGGVSAWSLLEELPLTPGPMVFAPPGVNRRRGGAKEMAAPWNRPVSDARNQGTPRKGMIQ
jgi:hypothetical protein